MTTTIKIKNSVTPGSSPAGLSLGEIAINVSDRKIFSGNAVGGVVTLIDPNALVTSVNGVTGAVINVARINEGNTYSVKQVMNAGITASTLNVAGVAAFNANTGDITLSGTNTYLNSTTTTVQNATSLLTVQGNAVGDKGTLRLKGYDGDVTLYNNDIKPQATQTGNLVHTLPSTTGTLLNSAVTSAVAGTGISVSASTGAVTFTNTGVQSFNGATGAVTAGVALAFSVITADQTAAINTGYIANKGTLLTLTLPTTAAVGSVIRVSGMNAGLWKIAQNASGIIHFGKTDTTTGVGGYISSTLARDAVELVCVVANNEWNVISSVGNITIV